MLGNVWRYRGGEYPAERHLDGNVGMTYWKKIGLSLPAMLLALLWNTQEARADDLEQLIRLTAGEMYQPMPAGRQVSQNEADQLIGSAMSLLGVAYRFGGTSPTTGMDCSAFMQYIFRRTMQVNLPRTSSEQAKVGTQVSRSALQPGDMVFFNTSGRRISHVGLYIGNDRFIHAPRTGKNIEITSLSNKYWTSRYVTARRVKKNDPSQFLN